jgi:hypothetical protein
MRTEFAADGFYKGVHSPCEMANRLVYRSLETWSLRSMASYTVF